MALIMLTGTILTGCGGADSATGATGTAPNPTSPASPTNPGSGTGSATISWSAPAENYDGSAITDLAGHRIYYGNSPDTLSNMIQVSNPGITLYVLDNLPSGKYYFALTAYNTSGAESDRSEIASKTVM
jgi:hypothetical protein